MLRTALFALTLAVVPLSSALADRTPNDGERHAIAATLGGAGYSGWGEIEWDDGHWEVDDGVGADGKRYDVKLDQDFNIVGQEIDD